MKNLGFLPGDLKDKIDPYLRPIYDALDDMIPPDKLRQYLEARTIEVAPLAFMRGRTLNNAYVILDEGLRKRYPYTAQDVFDAYGSECKVYYHRRFDAD